MQKILAVLGLLVLSVAEVRAEEKPCRNIMPRDCTLVLTFDDGPRKDILEGPDGLIALLAGSGVKASFFVQGWQAKTNPELVRTIARHGHLIANHTYGHGSLSEIAKRIAKSKNASLHWRMFVPDARLEFIRDAERAGREIYALVGYTPLFLRPPKWDIDQTLYCVLTEQRWIVQITEKGIRDSACPHLENILSRRRVQTPHEPREIFDAEEREAERTRRDVNTEDYAVYAWYLEKKDERFTDAVRKLKENVRNVIARREKAGIKIHILTFHELSITVEALKTLIPEWRRQGYRFENLPWIYGITEGTMQGVSEPLTPRKVPPQKTKKK